MRTAKFKAVERELRRSPFLYFNLRDLFENLIKDCESYKKQRDELIEDIKKLRERNEELKKKARAFDEIKSEYLKKDYQTGEEIFGSMGYIIDDYIIDELECEGIVVSRAAYKPYTDLQVSIDSYTQSIPLSDEEYERKVRPYKKYMEDNNND